MKTSGKKEVSKKEKSEVAEDFSLFQQHFNDGMRVYINKQEYFPCENKSMV